MARSLGVRSLHALRPSTTTTRQVEQDARPPQAWAKGTPARNAARRIGSPASQRTTRWSGKMQMSGTTLSAPLGEPTACGSRCERDEAEDFERGQPPNASMTSEAASESLKSCWPVIRLCTPSEALPPRTPWSTKSPSTLSNPVSVLPATKSSPPSRGACRRMATPGQAPLSPCRPRRTRRTRRRSGAVSKADSGPSP